MKYFIITIISLVVLFCLLGYWTNRQLDVEKINLDDDDKEKNLSPLKILHVSDLHADHLRVTENKLFKASRQEQPDLILITGDTIDRTEDLSQSNVLNLINQFSEIAPTFVIEGNHEPTNANYQAWRELIQTSKATLLENEVKTIELKGRQLNLIGLKNMETNLLEKEKIKLSNGGSNLLLAHHPELFEDYLENFKAAPLTAIFSGHAHGGQVRLPGIDGLLAPNQGYFPRLTNGAYYAEKPSQTVIYVSRGLSNSSFPFRIGNKPHLISLTLK